MAPIGVPPPSLESAESDEGVLVGVESLEGDAEDLLMVEEEVDDEEVVDVEVVSKAGGVATMVARPF